MTDATTVVDARGLRCPLPVVRLAAAARAGRPGDVVVLLSTDPAAEVDVAAWCRMRGHDLLEQHLDDDAMTHRVRLGSTDPATPAAPR